MYFDQCRNNYLVNVWFYYGAPDGEGDPSCWIEVDRIRFKTIDNNKMDSDYPIRRPDSGANYSFWKHIAIRADTPPNSFINNLCIYPGSSMAQTDAHYYVDQVADYDEATGTQGVTGDVMTNHAQSPTLNDLENYDSDTPFEITGSIGNETGRINDGYILLQVGIGASANIGYSGVENLVIRWDEA